MSVESIQKAAEFMREKKSLEEEVMALRAEVERLKEELAANKTAERLSAMVTLAMWGKEAVVDFMRLPM